MSSSSPLLHPSSCRLQVVLLLAYCYFCTNLILVNFGLTLTCMVMERNSTLSNQSTCGIVENGRTLNYGGTLEWSQKQQDTIIAAPYWGSIVMQLPSAYVVRKFSAYRTLLIVILIHCVMNALIPILAVNVGIIGVFACRLCIGLAHCFVDVLINTLINSWFPFFERSTALAIFAIGGQLAAIFGGLVTGHICESSLGWSFNFYLTSAIGFIFSLLWFCFGSASPHECRRITKAELIFLSNDMGSTNEKKKPKTPLLPMVTSFPVWAEFQMQMVICVASTISQSYLPTFYKERVLISAVMNGYFTAIPNLVSLLTRLFWSGGCDRLKRSRILSSTVAVKVSQGISSFGIMVSFMLLAFAVSCSTPAFALVISCVLAASQSLESAGHQTSLISLAPQHTEALSAFALFFAQGARLATPYMIGALLQNQNTGWQHVFLTGSLISTAGGMVFLILGSGEEQSWSRQMKTSVSQDVGESISRL